VDGYSLSSEVDAASPPMTQTSIFEGLRKLGLGSGLIAFDIETFSPDGFPFQAEDPIVNFSLVMPFEGRGIVSLSVIVGPEGERGLLSLLHRLLWGFRGAWLLTYNGSKFDLEYIMRRSSLYNLDFGEVFACLRHIDVYKLLKWLKVYFPRYDQKTVEGCLGIRRVIRYVSGSSYHHFYGNFLRNGDLTSMFYNIEDSFGCLKIAGSTLLRK